jgi:hypothetical protein
MQHQDYRSVSAKALDTGWWIGFAGFALLGLLLHQIYRWLSRVLDEEWANLIIAIPAFCAFFIVIPIRDLYVRYVAAKFCVKHGHDLESKTAKDGRPYVLCRRCYTYLRGSKGGAE